ncbi:hypothetical protein [Photobacterium sp. DNB22_13_2]
MKNKAEIRLRRYQVSLYIRLALRWIGWSIMCVLGIGWGLNSFSSISPDIIRMINIVLFMLALACLYRFFPSIRKLRLKDHKDKNKKEIVRLDFLKRKAEKCEQIRQLREMHTELKQRTKE